MGNEWTLVEHLTDLRKRMIYSLVVLCATFIGSLVFVNRIFNILEHPLGKIHLAVLGPGDVIQIYFMIAGFSALGLSLPFLLYQIWKFVKPALTPKETKFALTLLPFVFMMFVFGVLFAYFVIFPVLLHFLLRIAEQNFQIVMTAERYFSFLTNITLPFGFIFEMPIVLLFLTEVGIITAKSLSKARKYAYFAIVVFASLISPPELISHLSVATPMMALYEMSIILCRLEMKRKAKRELREQEIAKEYSSSRMKA